MRALFIGHTYIDVTVVADQMPRGDEKAVARDYAVSFGGNAVTAAFAAARLGIEVDLITSLADDWLGHMFTHMAATYGVRLHERKVERSSLSFIIPHEGRRAILRARDENFLEDFARLDISQYQALHLDGHQADAAIHYAQAFRAQRILTSLDGGGLRSNTDALLESIDVAIVAERLCEQMNINEAAMLHYLASKRVTIGGVTGGERGMLWYDEARVTSRLPALPIAREKIIDTSGAGDVFHGAYVASYLLHPGAPWLTHFEFARAAAAYKIQHLGNEAGLPSLAQVRAVQAQFQVPA